MSIDTDQSIPAASIRGICERSARNRGEENNAAETRTGRSED